MGVNNAWLAIGVVAAGFLAAPRARAALAGPVFPAPGGTAFTSSGSSSGDAGGKTFNYSGILVSSFSQLYWGPGGAITVALSAAPPATLAFDPTTSSLAAGIARFTASGVPYTNPNPGTPSGPLRVRFTITQTAPAPQFILAPAEIASSGAVVNVVKTGPAFSANLLFEAEYPPGSAVYLPVNQLPQLVPGTTQTSFNGGFYSAATSPAPATGLTATWLLALALPGLGLLLLSRRRQTA